MNIFLTDAEVVRFWSLVDKTGECWLWTGPLNHSGYGRFNLRGRRRAAHRVSLVIAGREIPDELCALHNCPGGDNRACVNPAHLWIGSRTENAADRDAKGRLATGERHGTHTHPERISRGSAHYRAKLDEQMVREIRLRSENGASSAVLSRDYGVNARHIRAIVTGEKWNHLAPMRRLVATVRPIEEGERL